MSTIEEKLSKRKQEILCGAIEDYIRCAAPITSGAMQKKLLQGTSTATLRNELATLESMGYLKQLHTSGGRVPTPKAYRFFVNSIMPDSPFDSQLLEEIKGIFENRTAYLTEIIHDIAKVVSRATNYPTVVTINGFDKLIIKSIRIIPLIVGSALVLIETNAGIINNDIDLKSGISDQNCVDASMYLTHKFSGKTIADMIGNMKNIEDDMEREIKQYKMIFNNLVDALIKMAKSVEKRTVVSESGTSKLLNNPEYNDIDKAKGLLELLEDKSAIENMMDNCADKMVNDDEISYIISDEDEKTFSNCSVVKADYLMGKDSIASIGVIGPQRMDYAKTASALKYIVDELQKANNKPKN